MYGNLDIHCKRSVYFISVDLLGHLEITPIPDVHKLDLTHAFSSLATSQQEIASTS